MIRKIDPADISNFIDCVYRGHGEAPLSAYRAASRSHPSVMMSASGHKQTFYQILSQRLLPGVKQTFVRDWKAEEIRSPFE